MTKPRCNQVCLDATPYYHCVARCVRRAFLCGEDHFSGKSFEHRRQWIIDKISELANIYAIDICSYAVMSNHYHLVVHINQQKALSWSADEVIKRWTKLFKPTFIIQRYLKNEALSKDEKQLIDKNVRDWRNRLYDLSWFMRCLNESLARMANAEDECTGRFWEGRYKSQALLDEAALLTCMSYVDLNPIRAGMAETPEASDYTSIQSRIQAHSQNKRKCQPIPLQKFIGHYRQDAPEGIHFLLEDYLQLVDSTGRAILQNKRGHIPELLAPILQRLGIDQTAWLEHVTQFEKCFNLAAGTIEQLQAMAKQIKQRWLKGASAAKQLYQAIPT